MSVSSNWKVLNFPRIRRYWRHLCDTGWNLYIGCFTCADGSLVTACECAFKEWFENELTWNEFDTWQRRVYSLPPPPKEKEDKKPTLLSKVQEKSLLFYLMGHPPEYDKVVDTLKKRARDEGATNCQVEKITDSAVLKKLKEEGFVIAKGDNDTWKISW